MKMIMTMKWPSRELNRVVIIQLANRYLKIAVTPASWWSKMEMEPPQISMKISLETMWWCRQMIWNLWLRPGPHRIIIRVWLHLCHWIWNSTACKFVMVSCKKMLTNQRIQILRPVQNRKRKADVVKIVIQRKRKTSCASSPNNCITDISLRFLNKKSHNRILMLTIKILTTKKTSTCCLSFWQTLSNSKSVIKTVNRRNIKRRSAQKIWRCSKKYISVHIIRVVPRWQVISSPLTKPIKVIPSAPRVIQGSPH